MLDPIRKIRTEPCEPATVGTVSFESTGAWSAWSTKTVTVSLNAGSNTIRLDPSTAVGPPNIDHLDVGGAAV